MDEERRKQGEEGEEEKWEGEGVGTGKLAGKGSAGLDWPRER